MKKWKQLLIQSLIATLLLSGLAVPHAFAAEELEDPLERAKMIRNPIATEIINVNMLENSDFEVRGPDGSITGWKDGLNLDADGNEISLVSGEDAYSGRSLRMKAGNPLLPIVLMSQPIRVEAGQKIELSGQFRVMEGELGVSVYAYDADSISLTDAMDIGPLMIIGSSDWHSASGSYTIPEGTHAIRIALSTRRAQETEVFVDALNLTTGKQMMLQDFGPPIESVVASRAAYTVENGTNIMYMTMNGASAQLAKINLDTFEVLDQVTLPDTIVRGLTIGSDGNVYTVGYNNGILTRYDPKTGKTENLNVILHPGHSVYDIVSTPDGKIYGGTYARLQDDYARGFEYDIATNEWRDLGVVMDQMKYVHSIAYDEVHDGVYFGLAPLANIRKFDRTTGEWAGESIPLIYNNVNYSDVYKFVFDLDAYDGLVYARLSQRQDGMGSFPNLMNLVFDAGDNDAIIGTFRNNQAREVSPPRDNKVYFIYYAAYNGETDRWLAYYDLEKDTSYRILPAVRVPGSYLSVTIKQLNHPDYPGDTLIMLKNDGVLFAYNFEQERHELIPLHVRSDASTVHAIGSANDGTIYVSGYTSGGYAKFDPKTNELTQITERMVGIGNTLYQSEMFIPYKEDQVFIPVYPGVIMHHYDPSKPWNLLNNGYPQNPARLYSMTSSSDDDQERVYAGEVIERGGNETLVTVTVPARNNRTGKLAFYDLSAKRLETYEPIPDQSLVSLVYKDGYLYGGSSVWNSYGDAEPLEPEAKMFIWDVEQNQLVKTFVPVPDKRAITKLIVGPDGNIWGFAEGHLFIYDPELDEVIYDEAKFNISYSSITYRDAFMEFCDDGYIYGTIQGRFFMIDPESKSVYVIVSGSRRYLAQSTDNQLFMLGPGQHLIKAVDPAAAR